MGKRPINQGEQNDVDTAINILERWYIIKQQVRQGKSSKDSHKALLDLLGIRNDNWTHASKNQSFYTHNVEIEIKPSKKEFLFLQFLDQRLKKSFSWLFVMQLFQMIN